VTEHAVVTVDAPSNTLTAIAVTEQLGVILAAASITEPDKP
jgi:hypothetical protein